MKVEIAGVVALPPADAGIHNAIVRLHSSRMDARRDDRSRFFRREPVVIVNPENGAKVVRYAMGSAGIPGVCKNTIALDYDGVDALDTRYKSAVALHVRRASTLEVYQWFWRHPDLSIQIGIRLGIIGAVLGVMGFGIGVASMLA